MAKTGPVREGDACSDVVIVVAASGLVVVAAIVVVESDDRSFQECQILKYRRLSRSTYQDSRYAALRPPPASLLTRSRPSSVILLLLSVRSILLASARSSPYPISSSLYRSLLLHFPLGFLRRIFRHPCRKPSCPHFPSRYLAHLPTSFGARAAPALLMKSRRYYAHAAMCTMYS